MTTNPNDDGKRHIFDDPRNVRRVIYVLYALCAITFIADAFVHRHVAHFSEALFGFYGIFGFVAFVVLVMLAKEVLRRAVMRREDYYDN